MSVQYKLRWEGVFIGCLLALWLGNSLRIGLFNPLGLWLYRVWFTPEANSVPLRLSDSIRIAVQLPSSFAWIMMAVFALIVTASFGFLHYRFGSKEEAWLRRRQRWIVIVMLLLLGFVGRLSDLALDSRIITLVVPDILQIAVTYVLFYVFWGTIDKVIRTVKNR